MFVEQANDKICFTEMFCLIDCAIRGNCSCGIPAFVRCLGDIDSVCRAIQLFSKSLDCLGPSTRRQTRNVT